jgi:hypothetical protein
MFSLTVKVLLILNVLNPGMTFFGGSLHSFSFDDPNILMHYVTKYLSFSIFNRNVADIARPLIK